MIIGIDLDDTAADSMPAYVNFYNEQHGTDFSKHQFSQPYFSETLGISREAAQTCFIAFAESGRQCAVSPMAGCKSMLHRLAAHNELHLITSRPNDLMQEMTLRYIDRNFRGLITEIHHCSTDRGFKHFRSKSSVCREISATCLIDDHPLHVIEAAGEGISTIIFDQPWNQNLTPHPNIARALSWYDPCIQRLCR